MKACKPAKWGLLHAVQVKVAVAGLDVYRLKVRKGKQFQEISFCFLCVFPLYIRAPNLPASSLLKMENAPRKEFGVVGLSHSDCFPMVIVANLVVGEFGALFRSSTAHAVPCHVTALSSGTWPPVKQQAGCLVPCQGLSLMCPQASAFLLFFYSTSGPDNHGSLDCLGQGLF